MRLDFRPLLESFAVVVGFLEVDVNGTLTGAFTVVVVVDDEMFVALETDVAFTVVDDADTFAIVADDEDIVFPVVDNGFSLLLFCFGSVLLAGCESCCVSEAVFFTLVLETVFVMITDAGDDSVSSVYSISGIIPIDGF